MEQKQIQLAAAELKFDDAGKFSGYASTFGNIDSYGDTVEPGAFRGTLKGRDRPVRMRWNHFGPIIGKWLSIKEDDHGLLVEGELTPGHTVASNVYASLKHGAVDGLSIGYRTKDYKIVDNIRHLKKIELIEISPVEEPADLGATVADVKSALDAADSFKELEAVLRDSGWSRDAATFFVSRCKALSLSESATNADDQVDLVRRFEEIGNRLTTRG